MVIFMIVSFVFLKDYLLEKSHLNHSENPKDKVVEKEIESKLVQIPPIQEIPKDDQSFTLIIDGIIFDLQQGRKKGISNVWSNLMPFLNEYFKGHLYFINRTPQHTQNLQISQLWNVKSVFPFERSLDNIVSDIIKESQTNVTFFLSTYYTYPNDLQKVCSVVLYHDLIPENVNMYYGQGSEYYPRIEILDKIDSIISVSHSTTNDLVKFYGEKIRHPRFNKSLPIGMNNHEYIVSTIHNRVDSKVFKGKVSSDYLIDFKKRYGLPMDKKYFLTVGSSYDYKNFHVMFGALSLLPQSYLDQIFLLMPGHAVDISEKEKENFLPCKIFYNGIPTPLYSGCNISAYIIHSQDDNELAAAYSGALALVYLSSYEGFGLPLVEALQQETLAIVTRVSSLPEVGGPEAPFYVTPGNKEEVKDAMIKILDMKPSEREDRIQKGLNHIGQFGGGPKGKSNGWSKMADLIHQHLLSDIHRGKQCYVQK
jgi:glycosyltransferase involved in cell wall biosynthesis